VDEDALVDKLREVERRLSRPGEATDPESCRQRLAEWRKRERDIEFKCAVSDLAQGVFIALCERHGLLPYRTSRRARSVCVQVPRGYMKEVFWPQFEALARVMEVELGALTMRVMERWGGVSLGRYVAG
jgi:hypothetical protein